MSRTKPLRVPVESLSEGELILDSEASNYVLRVHRSPVGQALELFDPVHSVEASAVLMRAASNAAVCHVGPIRDAVAVPKLDIALIQAFAKGEKVDQIIRDATALGVNEVVVVRSKRCIPKTGSDESTARQPRWQRIAMQAARQSGRGNLPRIAGPESLDDCIARVASRQLKLLLSPRAPTTLASLLSQSTVQPITLFIGPEGGLDAQEEQQLRDGGFVAVRFGDFTLRSETAATAVLGALVDWGGA